MLTPGTYRAVAIDAALGETSTGKEQVAVQFKLLDVDHSPLTWYGYFTEATEERTIESLRIAGWTGVDLTDLTDLCAENTPEVSLVIENEEDLKGVSRTRVKWINRPGGSGIAMKTSLDPEKARAFAARMKGRIVAHDKQAGKPRTSAPRTAPVHTTAQPSTPGRQAVPDAVAQAAASISTDDGIGF